MQTATDTLENLNSGLIKTTAELSDAALAPISAAMMQQLSGMLDQAQAQLTAMQEATQGDVVQLYT